VGEEYDPVQFTELQEQLHAGYTDISIAFGLFVTPGIVCQAREGNDETDEGNGIASYLVGD
jgi:hypothetical protein